MTKNILLAGASAAVLTGIGLMSGPIAAGSVALVGGASWLAAWRIPFTFSKWADSDYFFTEIPEGHRQRRFLP